MWFQILLSLSTVLLTGLAALCALKASRDADDAHDQAWKIRKSAGAIEILRDDMDAITKRMSKLAGRFYRNLQDEPEPDDPAPVLVTPPPGNWENANGQRIACENWSAAQLDGPGSAAAMCDCGYCEAMRRARHDAKAALVPKSNADRIASMRKGLGQ